jgi:phosphoribosylglycinamide formyltransferase 1
VARLAVLASGNGSNFQALVEALRAEGRHECVLLVHDRKAAYAAERASRLGIEARYVGYYNRGIPEAEAEIGLALDGAGADLTALAGFMRILSPGFVAARRGRLVNVHPSILPNWPGARAIERAFLAGEKAFGVTVHLVDEGMDTGPVIAQRAFEPGPGASLEEIEAKVHELEHEVYPRAVLGLLDSLGAEGRKR